MRLGGRARTTKDLDLSVPDWRRFVVDNSDKGDTYDKTIAIRERLQEMSAANLGDGFNFLIDKSMADLDAAPYGGARYPIEARLDARKFAVFHLDVGIGDAVMREPEWLVGPDMLGFAGIPPVRVAALAREQQFAEKLHAYTLPRGDRTNTRVKDLVDLLLLIELGFPNAEIVRQAIRATFARRGTHEAPATLEPPPGEWRAAFAQLAGEVELSATTLDSAYAQVAAFWVTLQPLD